MVQTNTFVGADTLIVQAVNEAEQAVNNWLEIDMIPRERIISTHTNLALHIDTWNFTITIIYETL